jgi:hypothetical protein
MAILNNSNAISSVAAYDINNSLRIRASASAYLNRTFGSGGSQTTWTWSAWVKKGLVGGTYRELFGVTNGASDASFLLLCFGANGVADTLGFQGWTTTYRVTSQLFRDPSAWYHIVVAVDTTQATAANRIRFYVNGSEITAFQTNNNPAQNATLIINSATTHNMGRDTQQSTNFDGYMAEVNFVNNQQLTPSSFGETDTTTGSWKPKAYTGTYGTNGFYLKFSDIALTSGSNAGLGKDFSGNTNYWTTNNISVTAGTTYDAMIDSPTLTSATVANYCVLNPLAAYSTITIKDGNLNITNSSDNDQCTATFGMTSGKWYWECVQTGGSVGSYFGIAKDGYNSGTYTGGDVNSWGFHSSGSVYNNASGTAYGNTWTVGDIIGVAFDADNGKIYFSKNGTWQNSGNPATSTNPAYSSLTSTPYFPAQGVNSTAGTVSINFGQRPFTYTPPSGYVALNTFNLPDSTIVKGNTVMDATLYTGNLTGQSITNAAAFKPDFVWIKSRSAATNNKLTDSVRGTTKAIISESTGTETTDITGLTAFNSNGFTVGASTDYNNTSATYVGWQWQAGQGSSSSNTSGDITSTVSVNATAGFSVVTYTGIGSGNYTVGHGLGVAPKMIIMKNRDRAIYWIVYHTSTGKDAFLRLNTTNASAASANIWGTANPTATVFGGAGTDTSNGFISGEKIVAYCWAEIAGFSKFGSYTGNGSTDGTFVYTGFRPKYILLKRTDSTGSWGVWDTSRDTYNAVQYELVPNGADAESAIARMDILSNGFKLRNTGIAFNASGGTYIYMAFAENPFKNANAR